MIIGIMCVLLGLWNLCFDTKYNMWVSGWAMGIGLKTILALL